ncbi:MAG: hypothetical protein JJ908_05525 [Rhizobiales bacterium]|nr:hypothetical protein [Hyphomicrobiales bacterium]MBO6697936.1 hypothetical protein [Hyphomicrobiales bacterium]MBO6735810.1 hypothetical protein [Hyphomicrobiales bacterium]MBO6913821.1 hypothetical protein [Hyphomicrobiales bacterium]MBO6955524.1 hypothetical protein [Hyphomicrobiales bacterium]
MRAAQKLSARIALASVVLLALPTTGWSDSLLASANGDWTGNGSLRISLDGALEPARCRVSNTYDASTSQLSLSGRCAVPGQTWTIEGMLVPDGGGYSGQWRDPRNDTMVPLTGQRAGSQLSFTFAGDDPDTGERLTGVLVWTFRQNQFSLESYVQTPERRVAVGELVFDR